MRTAKDIAMTETELQSIVAEADTVHEYRPNPLAVSYDRNRKRIQLVYADGSEHSFPISNVEAIYRLPYKPSDTDLGNVSLAAGGWSIQWPALDVHLPVDDVQECMYGSRGWMNKVLRENKQRS